MSVLWITTTNHLSPQPPKLVGFIRLVRKVRRDVLRLSLLPLKLCRVILVGLFRAMWIIRVIKEIRLISLISLMRGIRALTCFFPIWNWSGLSGLT